MDAINAPYSIKLPQDWKAIRAYTEGGGKPSVATAQKTFDELLQNIQLKNCTFRPDVVGAMFRRVPGQVAARNYGQEGLNRSYFVKDTGKNAELYRTSEPVQIISADTDQADAKPVVTLGAGEWTAYTVNCRAPIGDYETVVHARAENIPAEAQLLIDDLPCDVKFSTNSWSEINLGTHLLSSGPHHLKWLVKNGTVQLDWLEFSYSQDNRRD